MSSAPRFPCWRRRVLGVAAVVAALAVGVLSRGAAAASSDDEVRLPPVTRETLANGLRVVVAQTSELPLVEMTVMVGAGAAQDPPGQEGLATLTAATLTRGAGRLGAEALAEAIDALGGTLGAVGGTDATVVSAEFLAEDFAQGLELLRLVLREPRFEKDEVRRARDEQLAGLVAALEEPSAIAERCFAAFLYGAYPYGRPQDGRRESVERLGRRDVVRFWNAYYRPNNVILVLVGDVAPGEAVARISEAFGSWEPDPRAVPSRVGPPPPVAATRVLLVDMPEATQAQIRVGAPALGRNAPELLAAQVANTMLGGGFSSRLIEELRVKRSLTYGASSGFAARLTGGDFRLATFSKVPTAVETLELLRSTTEDFRTRPLDPKAVAKAKAYLRGQFPLRVETPDALAARLAEIEFFGLPENDLETFRGRVAAVTPAVASAAAARWIPPPDRQAIVVVGPASALRAPLEAHYGPVRVVTPAACEQLALAALSDPQPAGSASVPPGE